MSDENKVITPEQFVEQYNALCKETGFALVPVIATVPTNHGTFELTTKLEVRKLEK
jgi:hypothetical protein